jgi:hypothetical protein
MYKMDQFKKDFYKKINFEMDIINNKNILSNKICDQNILVNGGAETIGSSYIKQILKYKPSKITVVDINENGLTELTRDLRSSNLLDYNPEYITYPVNLLSDTFDKIFNSESWKVVANFSTYPLLQLNSGIELLKKYLSGSSKLDLVKSDNRSSLCYHPGFFQYIYYRCIHGVK